MPGELSIRDIRYRVHSVDHLEHLPRADEARTMLDRAVDVINVILKRRNWTIVRVSEFMPKNPNLLGLNVNHGEHVKVRIRPGAGVPAPRRRKASGAAGAARGRGRGRGGGARGGGRGRGVGGVQGIGIPPVIAPSIRSAPAPSAATAGPTRLYAWEEIMCTLIHEAVHVKISPHNAAFWKLYHELVAECEIIVTEGAAGRAVAGARAVGGSVAGPAGQQEPVAQPKFEAFAGAGARLGGGSVNRVTLNPAQEAAERRRLCAEAATRRLSAFAAALAVPGCCGSDMRTEQRQSQRLSQQHAGADAAPIGDDTEGGKFTPALPELDDATATWQCVDCDRWNHPDVGYCEFCCGNGGGVDGSEADGGCWSDASSDVVLLDAAGEVALAPPPDPKQHRPEKVEADAIPSSPEVIEID